MDQKNSLEQYDMVTEELHMITSGCRCNQSNSMSNQRKSMPPDHCHCYRSKDFKKLIEDKQLETSGID